MRSRKLPAMTSVSSYHAINPFSPAGGGAKLNFKKKIATNDPVDHPVTGESKFEYMNDEC